MIVIGLAVLTGLTGFYYMKINEVGLFEAKTKLLALLDSVEEGKTIFITRMENGWPSWKPAFSGGRPRRGSAQGKGFHISKDFDAPLPEFRPYMP